VATIAGRKVLLAIRLMPARRYLTDFPVFRSRTTRFFFQGKPNIPLTRMQFTEPAGFTLRKISINPKWFRFRPPPADEARYHAFNPVKNLWIIIARRPPLKLA
jgi:hypothetical protein